MTQLNHLRLLQQAFIEHLRCAGPLRCWGYSTAYGTTPSGVQSVGPYPMAPVTLGIIMLATFGE